MRYLSKLSLSIILLIFFSACNEKFDLGINLLPNSDLLDVQITDTVEVFMYTELSPRVRTDYPQYLFIGNYNDPYFGFSNSSFITQVLQSRYPNFVNPDLDSICLVLPLTQGDSVYGDGQNTILNLSVYRLTADLSSSNDYYSDEDPADYTGFEELGTGDVKILTYYYEEKNDTGAVIKIHDTTALCLRLNHSFGQELLDESDAYFYSMGAFTEVFKGIYVKNNTTDACIYKIDNTMSYNTTNFGLVIYYHNENDTTARKYALPINANGLQFNIFSHDYTTAPFYEQIQNPGTIYDSLAFLQSMAGTAIRIEIPGLINFDSIVVNKAELIVKNVSNYGESIYLPLEKIWLAGIDTSQSIVYFNDFAGGSEYEGASLENNEYHFFVTRIVQDYINGIYDNRTFGFYLLNLKSGLEFKRSVFATGKKSNPSKLVITYTKY